MDTIFDKTQIHFDEKLPFVVYRKPQETKLIGVFQKNDTLFCIKNYKEKERNFCESVAENKYLFFFIQTSSLSTTPINKIHAGFECCWCMCEIV